LACAFRRGGSRIFWGFGRLGSGFDGRVARGGLLDVATAIARNFSQQPIRNGGAGHFLGYINHGRSEFVAMFD
jgi:hypothetical protein